MCASRGRPPLVTSLGQITVQWLTAVLRHAGALPDGSVVRVASDAWSTSFCTAVRLRPIYSPEGAGPERLFLKFSHPGNLAPAPGAGAEVLFYRQVASRTPSPLVRCFDALFSSESGRWHVLLEDLSETHSSEPASQLPPSRDHCFGIVDAVAAVHAAWWECPPWELLRLRPPGQADVDARIADVRGRTARFVDFLADRLSRDRRAMYRAVLEGLPNLYRRLLDSRAYTVVHDDLHIGNALYPRNRDADIVRLIDWQTWHIDLGAKDLAHMMAVFWFPERRRRLELLLVRHYHERLGAFGVQDYSWDACWADYRLCVLRKLFHPAWQWETGHHPNIWWNHLERVWSAFNDLGCAELLGQ